MKQSWWSWRPTAGGHTPASSTFSETLTSVCLSESPVMFLSCGIAACLAGMSCSVMLGQPGGSVARQRSPEHSPALIGNRCGTLVWSSSRSFRLIQMFSGELLLAARVAVMPSLTSVPSVLSGRARGSQRRGQSLCDGGLPERRRWKHRPGGHR